MSRGGKVVLVLSVLLTAVVGAAVLYLGPIAPVATGYAAKNICSGHFLSDRPVDAVAEDLPSNPLVPFLRTNVDEEAQTVTTTLLGAWGTSAWFTPGVGCTLAGEDPGFAPLEVPAQPDPDAPWPAGGAPPADPDDTVEAALDPAFAEDDPEGRRRGTRAVVVVHQGELVAERYADGFGPDTRFIGWSVTKSLGNAIVGRLVHEGRLDVEADHLRPEWAGDERASITVEHLLHMTDGLAFDEVYEPDTDATQLLFRPRDMAAYAADKPMVAAPGSSWSYSSGTSAILCAVAQEAAGAGPALARDLVFDPIGMTSAVLEPDAVGGLACSSFGYATARDWARFGQWFLQDGVWDGERLLPEGWVDYSTTHIDADDDAGYGAHWWLNERARGDLRMPSVPADTFWASGHEGQQVVVVPSADLVVVRLGLSTFEGIDWGLETLLNGVLDAVEEGQR